MSTVLLMHFIPSHVALRLSQHQRQGTFLGQQCTVSLPCPLTQGQGNPSSFSRKGAFLAYSEGANVSENACLLAACWADTKLLLGQAASADPRGRHGTRTEGGQVASGQRPGRRGSRSAGRRPPGGGAADGAGRERGQRPRRAGFTRRGLGWRSTALWTPASSISSGPFKPKTIFATFCLSSARAARPGKQELQ